MMTIELLMVASSTPSVVFDSATQPYRESVPASPGAGGDADAGGGDPGGVRPSRATRASRGIRRIRGDRGVPDGGDDGGEEVIGGVLRAVRRLWRVLTDRPGHAAGSGRGRSQVT
jgi:hypothetical protein